VADTINTITLGIIEGITEFLPISSTGHLLVAEQWLGARSELFNVAIQAGAILAIVLIYWRRLLALLTALRRPGEPRLPVQAHGGLSDHRGPGAHGHEARLQAA
jgi:undecaprenyl pyrophosphate phosphatase UppP